MALNVNIGEKLPDFALPDHRGEVRRLSGYTRPSPMDRRLGFLYGYPMILTFGRGFFCPRDQQQMRGLVAFQDELAVNYCKLVSISADPPKVQAAFRAGLGASWPFLSDEGREAIRSLDILDATEGEYADVSRPYTLVVGPDLTLYKVYDGWFFVGRPTTEELRQDLRALMQRRPDYSYEAYDTPEVKSIRIPQKEWEAGAPSPGKNGRPVAEGVVQTFDTGSGSGEIYPDNGDSTGDGAVFFNFTAIPGEGYRTIRPGTRVRFEIVEHPDTSLTARNVQEEIRGGR